MTNERMMKRFGNAKRKTQNAKPRAGAVSAFVCLSVIGTVLGEEGATQPRDLLAGIPIGRETTYVTGPRNADGTINYVAAANAMMRPVTPEENAASLILRASDRGKAPFQIPEEIYRALGVAVPPEGNDDHFEGFNRWLEHHPEKLGSISTEEWDKREMEADAKPWTGENYTAIADWLSDQRPYLELLSNAASRGKYYVPLVSSETPPTMLKALPTHMSARISMLSSALACRAYGEIGSNQIDQALHDLRTLVDLGVLTSHSQSTIENIIGAMVYIRAMRGYRYVALQSLNEDQGFAALTQELGAPYSSGDTDVYERLFMLDSVMQVMRGDAQPQLRLLAFQFDETTKIDEGDLGEVNWEIVLRGVQKRIDDLIAASRLPRNLKVSAFEYLAEEDRAARVPSSLLSSPTFDPSAQRKSLESFLKKRLNESVEDYSHRMALLFCGDAANSERSTRLLERPTAERGLTETTIALARFHAATGNWPDSLEALTPKYLPKVPIDPFSDEALRYRRNGDDFVLYSVGLNEKDDGGVMDSKVGADDLVVTAKVPVRG